MTKMIDDMVNRFLTPDPQGRSVMYLFSPLLVSGSLSCYSTTGNPRHVMPFITGILDQSDRQYRHASDRNRPIPLLENKGL